MNLSKVTASRLAKQMIIAGCSFRNLTDKPYPPELQVAVSAGTVKPDDCTVQNPSYATASGLDTVQPEVVSEPEGQKYGYGQLACRKPRSSLRISKRHLDNEVEDDDEDDSG